MPFVNNVPEFRFFCFFVERILMDSSCILWKKVQDYQLWFILTDHFLITAWPVICDVRLESCLLTARQHGSYDSHSNRRFFNTQCCRIKGWGGAGFPPPPPIIFERLKLPQQIIYRRKGNLSESPNHLKYRKNILISRFYEQSSQNSRNLGHF